MVFSSNYENTFMNRYITFLIVIISQYSFSQNKHPLQTTDSLAQIQWVNKTYNGMTLDEKIGQLFIADVWSAKPKAHTDKIIKLIKLIPSDPKSI